MGIYFILATGEFGPTSKRFNASPRSPKNSEAASLGTCGAILSRRHGDTEKSSRSERRRPRRHQQLSLRGLYGNSAKPNTSKYGPNSCACRIQTHRSRAGYWNGFERALAHSAWVVQFGAIRQSASQVSGDEKNRGFLHQKLSLWERSCPRTVKRKLAGF